jgi:hypothetical protein
VHQTDHVVELLSLLIHVDGEVWLVRSQVHSLGVFQSSLCLKLASFVDVELCVLAFRQVSGDDLVGLVPFVGPHVHLEGEDVLSSQTEVLLCKIVLSDLSVVVGDLLVVRPGYLSWLILDELDGSVPVAGSNCCFYCFGENSSLNVVLNS